MRILMRNTVFKTAALAGLFSCMLALVGAFPGITTSVHATTAEEVGTDPAKLQKFVEAAVDEFYIEFLIKQHCDFSTLPVPVPDLTNIPTEEVKKLILLADSVEGIEIDPKEYCEKDKISSFGEVFREDGDWKSGSIYLAVMNDQREILFHGSDENLEGMELIAFDEGGRDVGDEIITEVQDANEDGLVAYCWDDPTVVDDDIDDNDPRTAPGYSWKIAYVVDPFVYLGLPPSDVIFASGIYPKTGNPPLGCEIFTDMEETDDTEETDDMEETDNEITEVIKGIADSGGCAIAAGSDSTPRGTAFNLLLIVSALFFTISFRSRAMDKRNGVRS